MDAFHEPRPQSYDPKSGTLPGLGVSTSTIVLAGRGMMKPVLGTSASCLDSVNRSAALPGNGEEVGAEAEKALFLFHPTRGSKMSPLSTTSAASSSGRWKWDVVNHPGKRSSLGFRFRPERTVSSMTWRAPGSPR